MNQTRSLLLFTAWAICLPAADALRLYAESPPSDPATRSGRKETAQRIHPDVIKQVGTEGRAYVLIRLKVPEGNNMPENEKKVFRKKAQQELIAKVDSGQLTIDREFVTMPYIIAWVDNSAVKKLAQLDEVLAVDKSKIEPEIFPALEAAEANVVTVIIALKGSARDERDLSKRAQAVKEAQDKLLMQLSPQHIKNIVRFQVSVGLACDVSAIGLEQLAINSDVWSVALDIPGSLDSHSDAASEYPRHPFLVQSVVHTQASTVHDIGYSGDGVTVAVIDSGVTCNDPEISGSCVHPGFVFGGNNLMDPNGHGTYMAAIISANGPQQGPTVVGIAPNAGILPLNGCYGDSGQPLQLCGCPRKRSCK